MHVWQVVAREGLFVHFLQAQDVGMVAQHLLECQGFPVLGFKVPAMTAQVGIPGNLGQRRGDR